MSRIISQTLIVGVTVVLLFAAGAAKGEVPSESTTPALTVDDQVHLGAFSDIFKDGQPFLWSDADNLALGQSALRNNTTGGGNVAVGQASLYSSQTDSRNTAVGFAALYFTYGGGPDPLGSDNTGVGYGALYSNTSGYRNTASGSLALYANTTGLGNTGVGNKALYSVTTGRYNTAIGISAGYLATTGYDNIFIGSGAYGVSGDNKTIRIGGAGSYFQTRAFINGIRGTTTGLADAVAVLIDSNGQLGTVSSSVRYKEEISDMGSVSGRLHELRPVTFRFRKAYEDGEKPLQFGLVAEEVAEVFPELVVYDDQGRPETVKYHVLSALLLNEVQKQAEITEAQAQVNEEHARRLAELEALARGAPGGG